MPSKRGSRRSGKTKNYNVDREIVNSHKLTGSTTTIVASDLNMRRQNFNIVQRPPKNIGNQIFWCQFSTQTQLSVSGTTFVESNQTFTLNLWPEYTQATAFFDQYCIYAVCCQYSYIGNATTPVRVHTAIDYDSVTAVGSVSGIQNFGTYALLVITQDTSGERFIKPCIAPQVTSSNVPVPGGIGRSWIDSAYPAVAHYGLRMITDTWVSTASNVVNVVYTAICGFRNNL